MTIEEMGREALEILEDLVSSSAPTANTDTEQCRSLIAKYRESQLWDVEWALGDAGPAGQQWGVYMSGLTYEGALARARFKAKENTDRRYTIYRVVKSKPIERERQTQTRAWRGVPDGSYVQATL